MKTQPSDYARKMFLSCMSNKNIMTPYIINYYQITDKIVVELSRGKFIDSYMFAVSVVKDYQFNSSLGQCFPTREQAEEYIDELKLKYVKINIPVS